jgi:alkylation response protein AidB-like acyl-CoA dehydrogenase
MYSREFYQDLLQLAQQDLSQAHLHQHFITAAAYVSALGQTPNGQGAWSALKPADTLIYNNGTVTGKKYWVSGVELCDWVLVPVKNGDNLVFALIDKKNIVPIPILTQGMEGTVTVHFTCDQAPAQLLGDRADPKIDFINHAHSWCFITNHLGIATATFHDIDLYTKNNFSYIKDKIRLDLEVLNLLWTSKINNVSSQTWDYNNTVYAFAKKVVTQVAQLATEITGSGLFEIDHPSHQRYKDILIYSTHMRNTAAAIKDIVNWSF